MDNKQIKDWVKNKYGDIAKSSTGGCDCSCSCGSTAAGDYAKQIGYVDDEISSVPDGANLGLGCGNPTAILSLNSGETVLDLGSGAGFDSFLAAKAVGETGKVIGVDMTPEMIKKANINKEKGGFQNVEFKLEEIENLPVADKSIDVIISNCVINLSPDKKQVFKEAFRVLKEGGRLMVSDIVLEEELPPKVKQSLEAYAGCIAGASLKVDYLGAIKRAGFQDIEIIDNSEWLSKTLNLNDKLLKSEGGVALADKLGVDQQAVIKIARSVKSMRVLAWKR